LFFFVFSVGHKAPNLRPDFCCARHFAFGYPSGTAITVLLCTQ
jgi:hypothetical protein